jgi:small-conductance mechanosensitive channel
MLFWHRLIIAAAFFLAVLLLARLVDWRMSKKTLTPEAMTRYRVIRRTVTVSILVVGFFSALLVIPQVRAVAGGLLASSAVVGLIIGFASQRTLGNFVAGILIAVAQPVRLGDRVTYNGEEGVVEEIGLTYTFIRTTDQARIVVPNEKLASDTIRNASIRSEAAYAEVQVQVPLSTDLRAARDALAAEVASEPEAAVYVSALNGSATLTVRASAGDEDDAQALERELRVRAHERLRALGIWG